MQRSATIDPERQLALTRLRSLFPRLTGHSVTKAMTIPRGFKAEPFRADKAEVPTTQMPSNVFS